MANRDYIFAVRSESTNSVRSLFVAISDTGRRVVVRQDARYDEGTASDTRGLVVNLYNNTTTARSTYYAGAVWTELVGDGQTFDIPNDEEIIIEVGVTRAGHTPARVATVPSGGTQRPITIAGADLAGSIEISEDGYARPFGTQVDDWDFELRPVVVPADGYAPRYTTREMVREILRASQNVSSGWEANFGSRVSTAIETAEIGIDAYVGFRFQDPVQTTRDYRAEGNRLLVVNPFLYTSDAATPVVVQIGDRTIGASSYRFEGPHARTRNIYNVIRTSAGMSEYSWLSKDAIVSVQSHEGFPVPADVRNYAGKWAADILRFDAMRAGMLEVSGAGAAYAKIPGKDISYFLSHYKSHAVM